MSELDDRDMRRLYERNAPEVEPRETWEAVRERVSDARPRRRRMRLVAICATVLVVLGVVSVGAYELVEHLRAPQPLLILGGDEEPADPVVLTVFLDMDITTDQTSALWNELSAMPEIATLTYVSKEEALARLREFFADRPDVLENLMGNPLPASLEVRLVDDLEAPTLAERLSVLPGVDEVIGATAFGNRIGEPSEAPSSTSSVTTPGD
jgi:hypothetical protein